MSRFHGIMGRFPGVAPKVNIGESTKITFRATLGDLLIAYPMKIQITKIMRSFTRRTTTPKYPLSLTTWNYTMLYLYTIHLIFDQQMCNW